MADRSCPIEHLAAGFHHQDPGILEDPWPLFERLRSECPVAHSDKFGGFWILSRYDDILDAARDTRSFSSAHGVVIPPMGVGMPLLPFETDPPEHTAYRRLLMRHFAAPAVAKLEPFASAEADRLLDGLEAAGRADLVDDYALPLTAAVFGQLLALPVEDRTTLAHWTNRIMERVAHPEAAAAAILALKGYLDDLIRARRANPGDDILGILLTSEVDSRALSHEEILSLCFTFVLAGLETTTPHRCIGADLARMEIAVALRHLLRRYPEYYLPDEALVVSFKPARGPPGAAGNAPSELTT